MMSLIQRYQNFIVIAVVIIAGFIAYSFFFTGGDEQVLSTTEVAQSAEVDRELIALLLELKGITLDESLFADQRFRSLQDFSQDLVAEPVGRVNPFAPLGSAQ